MAQAAVGSAAEGPDPIAERPLTLAPEVRTQRAAAPGLTPGHTHRGLNQA